MKARSAAKATYEDLMNVPDNLVAALINEELSAWPRARGTLLDTLSAPGMRIGPHYLDCSDDVVRADLFPAAEIDLAPSAGATTSEEPAR